MSQSLAKIFTVLTPLNSCVLDEIPSVVYKNTFTIASGPQNGKQITLACTQNYLFVSEIIQGQEVNHFCSLDFKLKFQVLRAEWTDQRTPGTPYGIKFDQDNSSNYILFNSASSFVLEDWIDFLSKRINQRNFHKLFKAKKKIGKGAFATVYLAERLKDHKMVAVKAFSKQKQFSGDKGKQSLQNQIKLMRNVDHPNITKLQQVYETQNSIYVILECLQGRQLNQEIKSGRKFSTSESVTIIKKLLQGLEHLNQKRIIHRDLKPQNIMFKNTNTLDVSICDFGLATYADQQKYLFVRCGTPGFVAPEIINIRDLSIKSQPISDVFSAGVIAHLLFMGHSVFPGKKYNEVLAQNRACQFNFNKKQYQSVDPQVLSLIISMLQKNPNQRITPTKALQLPIFNVSKQTQMDIEQPSILKKKQSSNGLNFKPTLSKNITGVTNSSNRQSMTDENQNQNLPNNNSSIGQAVKGKISFMANNSSFLNNNTYVKPHYRKIL